MIQRRDVESQMIQCCFNVVCLIYCNVAEVDSYFLIYLFSQSRFLIQVTLVSVVIEKLVQRGIHQ